MGVATKEVYTVVLQFPFSGPMHITLLWNSRKSHVV
jgi:hypothetical protein